MRHHSHQKRKKKDLNGRKKYNGNVYFLTVKACMHAHNNAFSLPFTNTKTMHSQTELIKFLPFIFTNHKLILISIEFGFLYMVVPFKSYSTL